MTPWLKGGKAGRQQQNISGMPLISLFANRPATQPSCLLDAPSRLPPGAAGGTTDATAILWRGRVYKTNPVLDIHEPLHYAQPNPPYAKITWSVKAGFDLWS